MKQFLFVTLLVAFQAQAYEMTVKNQTGTTLALVAKKDKRICTGYGLNGCFAWANGYEHLAWWTVQAGESKSIQFKKSGCVGIKKGGKDYIKEVLDSGSLITGKKAYVWGKTGCEITVNLLQDGRPMAIESGYR